ncbi:MAG: ABC transporter ATP-binding protein [Acidobacteriota bacterium]
MSVDGRTLLADVELAVAPGRLLALVGPTGAGKTTLLRCLAGLLAPGSGRVLVGDRDLATLGPKERARQVGWVPQLLPELPEIRVRDLVASGRFSHQGLLGRSTPDDRAAVDAALEQMGLEARADDPLGELSGGQLRLALVARALAQDAPLLLLDEPTAGVDSPRALRLMERLLELLPERSLVLVSHDLNLAAQHADDVLLLSDGRIRAQGAPAEVLTEARLTEAFGPGLHVDTWGDVSHLAGRPRVLPRRADPKGDGRGLAPYLHS